MPLLRLSLSLLSPSSVPTCPSMPTCSWGDTLVSHVPPYYISTPQASRPTHPQEPRTRLDWSLPRTLVALIWILWGSSAPLYWHVMRRMLCELNIFPCFLKKRHLPNGTHIHPLFFMYVCCGQVRPFL